MFTVVFSSGETLVSNN